MDQRASCVGVSARATPPGRLCHEALGSLLRGQRPMFKREPEQRRRAIECQICARTLCRVERETGCALALPACGKVLDSRIDLAFARLERIRQLAMGGAASLRL